MARKNTKGGADSFLEYLRSASSEKSRNHLLYPLFTEIFKDKVKIENDAKGADVYVQGKLIVEAKSSESQWLEGFYQALHYHKKFGLSYNTIMVVAHEFVAIWKLNKIPEFATIFAHKSDPQKPPNEIGRENARKTTNALKIEIKDAAFYWLDHKLLQGNIFEGTSKSLTYEVFAVKKILANLESDRISISPHNFIEAIERMKVFFATSIEAVHAFYSIVAYWDISSTASMNSSEDELRVIGFKGNRNSDAIKVIPRNINDVKKFIETHYIFTNEGSGLTVDYYFSRFDEVLSKIDPEYVKQHGIFFTNDNLSKFALWYVKEYFSNKIHEDYIVFDPAGGSGNLVSSWRGKLKHKIISELQPDLLKIIERRMKVDPFHVESGFTVVPKTVENKGLNFLDRYAADYLGELKRAVHESTNIAFDKPIAFLLNPPYKNTDENVKARESREAEYGIHKSIIDVTGEDAGKERYLAFLGQILNISKVQAEENNELHPVVMIFTPTSWLIPRPTYVSFREKWDKHFKFHNGFIVTSNEWFKLDGKWPLTFTIWTYNENGKGNNNKVKLLDLTKLGKKDLAVNWNLVEDDLKKELNKVLKGVNSVVLDNTRGDIKTDMPLIPDADGNIIPQTRLNIYRNKTKEEKDKEIISGYPYKDERHKRVKTPYGFSNGNFVGFMDDNTPVRLVADALGRLKNTPDRVWFYLDNRMIQINTNKVFSSAPDKYGYCAYDLETAKFFFSWFAIAKSIVGFYPIWANQYNIWTPKIPRDKLKHWHSLCFAFVLAENRCVVTKFEKDNPVIGTNEIFVDNPLCPMNKDSFWSKYLDKEICSNPSTAKDLVDKIKELYKTWNLKYCKGQVIKNVGLQDEPYFKYFDYADFLTPFSGLIQIRKFAENEGKEDLQNIFKEIFALTKKVREEIYRLLVEEFKYFE